MLEASDEKTSRAEGIRTRLETRQGGDTSREPTRSRPGEECNRKWQEGVEDRLAVIERQMERLGAPQYRIVHINGKPPLIVERVKLPALGK